MVGTRKRRVMSHHVLIFKNVTSTVVRRGEFATHLRCQINGDALAAPKVTFIHLGDYAPTWCRILGCGRRLNGSTLSFVKGKHRRPLPAN